MGYGIELTNAETDIRKTKRELTGSATLGTQPVKWPTSASIALVVTMDMINEAIGSEDREALRANLIMLAARAAHWAEQLDETP